MPSTTSSRTRCRRTLPRPPNMDVIVALNRGPFVAGASAPLPRRRRARRDRARRARRRGSAAGHLPGALNVPLSGGSFATKSAFVLGDGPVVVHARSDAQAQDAARALRAVGLLELEGFVVDPPGSEERLEAGRRRRARTAHARRTPWFCSTCGRPTSATRATSRARDTSRIGCCPRSPTAWPTDRRSRSAARAHAPGIAASVLAARGVDARPVLNGGVEDWQQRGGRTIEFRRCGSWRRVTTPTGERRRARALRPARADLRPIRAPPLVRPGSALAPLPRLARRGRPRATRVLDVATGRARSRSSSRARNGCTVVGLDQSAEMLAAGAAIARAGLAEASGSSRARPSSCRSRTRRSTR